jgi:hypothetical protein
MDKLPQELIEQYHQLSRPYQTQQLLRLTRLFSRQTLMAATSPVEGTLSSRPVHKHRPPEKMEPQYLAGKRNSLLRPSPSLDGFTGND